MIKNIENIVIRLVMGVAYVITHIEKKVCVLMKLIN